MVKTRDQKKKVKVGGIRPSDDPELTRPKIKRDRPQKIKKYKGGGMAGMRRFNRGGKV